MSHARLPDGFVAELDPRARWLDDGGPGRGAVLLGGSPPAILRLAPAARTLLRNGAATVAGPASAALARRLLDTGIAQPRPSAGPALPVTIVVPVRDNPAGLDRLLAALNRTAAEAAVIVVDDGSAQPAAAARIAHRHAAGLLRHDRPTGPAAARNTGLAAATTPLVAFCDSDVRPRQAGWLHELRAQFADPAVALVAPRIAALPGAESSWIARYEQVRSALDLGPRPARIRPNSAVAYVPSAVVVVRAAAVGDGFDPGMHVAEDVDLVLRLHAAGWRLRYHPQVSVAHQHRARLRPWLARKAFYGTGAAPLAVAHPGQVPPLRLAPWTAAACLALAAQRAWSAPATLVLAAAATVWLRRSLHGVRRPWGVALRLAGEGFAGAAWQAGSALVRHWWPATALACLASRRARRAVAVAAVTEGVADWWHRGREVPLAGYLAAHRFDDLAYGAGLWWGAWRHRTMAPLLPRVVFTH